MKKYYILWEGVSEITAPRKLYSTKEIHPIFIIRYNLYPFNAVSLTSCKVIRLSKSLFLELLKLYPEVCFDMNKFLSQGLYFKHIMAQNISTQNPTNKLKTLLDYLKSLQIENKPYSFLVPLTRQQLADLTGLCVETVIRALKKMEKSNMLQIENRKIMY